MSARALIAALAAAALLVGSASGQRTVQEPSPLGSPAQAGSGSLRVAFDEAVAAQSERVSEEAGASPDAAGLGGKDGQLSTAVEVALLLTLLSLLPAALITLTSFTRIVIVLSFVRRALSVNELPPNPVIIGLALFLTMFVMAPVGERLYAETWAPYQAGELTITEAGESAWETLGGFLLAQTRESELKLFAELAADGAVNAAALETETQAELNEGAAAAAAAAEMPPMRVLIPAFILSELKTAFQMGFLLFLPFLVIDLVVSSVLLSMGMMMLPPVMISTPIKVLVFVLVDGWRLVCESVVTSFIGVST
ncbi:MAG: flagellar type III secretion system pore protein FliP [Planctomycetota bacterium]